MLKQTITYPDYNGGMRTQDFHFNYNKAEALEMEMSTTGGFTAMINKIVAAEDMPTIFATFKKFILGAYGVKSADGVSFEKTAELTRRFEQSEAFSQLLMEISTDAVKAAAFVNGVLPKDMNVTAPQVVAATTPAVENTTV